MAYLPGSRVTDERRKDKIVTDQRIRVMIVDDHNMVRSSLAMFLDSYSDIALIGQATNGQQAVQMCREHAPDVVLMDLIMPVMDGVDAIREILREQPEIRILALTSFKVDDLVYRAMEAGAAGYLLKDDTTEELVEAIRDAYAGKTVISPDAMQALLNTHQRASSQDALTRLTDREIVVLRLLSQGLTNRQIADDLSLSPATVKFHVSSILSKLNASSRTEAVAIALQRKLI